MSSRQKTQTEWVLWRGFLTQKSDFFTANNWSFPIPLGISILASNFVNKDEAILTVISTSGVNLRSYPDQNANILDKVNYGEQLSKIGDTGERENILGINGLNR